jgi:hypothetical protein
MNREKKTCQNCKTQFTIEPEDFVFYDKIKVPPPTFCPECRMIRRMGWRNERSLYKRQCDAPGHTEEIVSIFSQNIPVTVYDQKYWWSDQWDAFTYGKEYDFSKPFFVQFREFLEKVPLLPVFNGNAVNTEFANHALDNKNSYLITAAYSNENVLYSNRIVYTRDSLDLYLTDRNELCYENVNSGTSTRIFYSFGCEECTDSAFLYDCRNCSSCFGCVGLRNKSYHIFNKPYTKEEYLNEIKKYDMGSYHSVQQVRSKHQELMSRFPRKYMYSFKVQDVVGDIVGESKNSYQCFDSVAMEDCKYVVWNGEKTTDTYDGYGTGFGELLYETVDAGLGKLQEFSVVIWGGHDVQYSYNCHGCNNIFGCTGLRQKQYCILNKQYTKEEYERLVPKIIDHMNTMPYKDKKGRIYKYGEFFPQELSPFAYNETVAQEYFPLTKEEAENQGYTWKDPEPKNYEITLKTQDIPDHIKDVTDSILKEVIQCAHVKGSPSDSSGQIADAICNEQCTQAFRIIPQELEFYRTMNLPIPRLCPNCRHYQRIKQRNPLKLWHRQCTCKGTESGVTNKESGHRYTNTSTHFHKDTPCPNEFETSYAPEREEIVYCEECYQQEVV